MNKIPNGGFPPIKLKKIITSTNKQGLHININNNINIREIISNINKNKNKNNFSIKENVELNEVKLL